MMINIRTRDATVNIALSTSKNAALTEGKILQYTTLSIKLHRFTLSELKIRVLTLSDVVACLSMHCTDQKKNSNPPFFKHNLIVT